MIIGVGNLARRSVRWFFFIPAFSHDLDNLSWSPGRFHNRCIHNGTFLYQKPMGFDLAIDLLEKLLRDTQFHKGISEPADGAVIR